LQPGDRFNVTSGDGIIHTCRYDSIIAQELTATIQESYRVPAINSQIQLFVGLPERDSFEQLLVDCTAMGIKKITPVISEFCQKDWWKSSWEKHSERFRNKMISALKQSLYPYLPILESPVKLGISLAPLSDCRIVADPEGIPVYTIDNLSHISSFSCFIGPPGGFSDSERETFTQNGFFFAKISPTRLRSELASVVLCAQIIGGQITQ
jgi:16S rRNA (uracil1498-N3)-methyltransferase